ncbi:MAG: thiol:disulfide interchange protein DsbA/DsbL [Neisseriaceae bacterium]
MKYSGFVSLLLGLLASMTFAGSTIQEGKDYTLLSEPIPAVDPSRVEIIEAFSYTCIHCQHFEPLLLNFFQQHAKQPITLRKVHVYWGNKFLNLIRLNVAVQENHVGNVANSAIFKAILEDGVDLSQEINIINWLNAQTNFDGKQVAKTYQLASTQLKSREIAKLTKRYGFEATPTLVVAGKYKVNLAALTSETDLERILTGLVELARRGTSIKLYPNSGAELVARANGAS